MAPDVGVTTGVCILWQQEELVDYTIEVDDKHFKVHKVIMASVSDYFKAMLTGGMVESQTDRVRLEGLDSCAVSNMIEYVYTGQFGTKTARTEDLLGCAVYFQFPSAIKECTDLLCQEINEENCFDVHTIFKAYSLEHGVEYALKYIKANIDNILKICQPNELSYDGFLILMDSWEKSEWDLFDSVNLWISVDFENHIKHLNDLMSHIRFALMTPDELAAVRNTYTFSAFNGSWCDLVHKAVEYHNLSTHQKVLDDSEQCTVRCDPSPLCFSAEYDCDGEHYVGKSWTRHEALQTPDFNLPVVVLKMNNFLIVLDSSYIDKHWHIFDPRTRKWSMMEGLATPREAFALAHHGKHLYVLGGIVGDSHWSGTVVDSIERFDFETNSWCEISSKLPVALQRHGACTIGSFIYVTGGWSTLGDARWHCSQQLQCFDPSTFSWESKTPMPHYISYCSVLVMNLWNEEVLFVISRDFHMQYYTPSTNTWSVYKWFNYVHTELCWAAEGTILGEGNLIVLLKFKNQRGPFHKAQWGCAKWIAEENGQKVSEVLMDTFPLGNEEKNEKKDYFCALLSFQPQS